MRNCFQSSTVTSTSFPKSVSLTIFTTAFIVTIVTPILPCYAEDQRASGILQEASGNVEKYRKADATISFSTEAGKPIKGAEVVIEQTSHDFLFGNIMFPVVGVLGKFEDIQVYRPELFKERFADVFNMAIFPFCWSSYEEITGREDWDKIVPIVDWCKLNGITPKGHPLVWVERGRTAEDGSIDFRGFYGDYKITLKSKEGGVYTFNIHLEAREANRWEFQLLRN